MLTAAWLGEAFVWGQGVHRLSLDWLSGCHSLGLWL